MPLKLKCNNNIININTVCALGDKKITSLYFKYLIWKYEKNVLKIIELGNIISFESLQRM